MTYCSSDDKQPIQSVQCSQKEIDASGLNLGSDNASTCKPNPRSLKYIYLETWWEDCRSVDSEAWMFKDFVSISYQKIPSNLLRNSWTQSAERKRTNSKKRREFQPKKKSNLGIANQPKKRHKHGEPFFLLIHHPSSFILHPVRSGSQ